MKDFSQRDIRRMNKKVKKWRDDKEEWRLQRDRRVPLARKISRNINQLMIVVSIRNPEFNAGLVDRFILLAGIEDLEPIVCITKTDLVESSEEIEKWKDLYESLGVPTLAVSSQTGDGIKKVRKKLQGKRTALSGHSGVGKSTLLNAVSPELSIDTGSVNLMTGKGKHVTKTVKLYRLDEETDVFDLPGIKLIDFPDLTQQDVANRYPDFNPYSRDCKFNNCTHIHEPSCAVKDAVGNGLLLKERYDSYIRIVSELGGS